VYGVLQISLPKFRHFPHLSDISAGLSGALPGLRTVTTKKTRNGMEAGSSFCPEIKACKLL